MNKAMTEKRSRNMKAIKSKGSKIERMLAKELWSLGLRYTKNDKKVFGKPDFCYRRKKVAVFVDSEFWHGKDWDIKKEEIKSNRDFWISKIQANIKRDSEVNNKLTEYGWVILRFWGKEIMRDVSECARKVQEILNAASDKNKRI